MGNNFDEDIRDGYKSPEVMAKRARNKFVFLFLFLAVMMFVPLAFHPIIFIVTFVLLLFWLKMYVDFAAFWKELERNPWIHRIAMLAAIAIGAGGGFLFSHLM